MALLFVADLLRLLTFVVIIDRDFFVLFPFILNGRALVPCLNALQTFRLKKGRLDGLLSQWAAQFRGSVCGRVCQCVCVCDCDCVHVCLCVYEFVIVYVCTYMSM